MLILILIDVQYSRKAIFSFKKSLNCQNHSFSGSISLVKKSPPVKFQISPHWGGGSLPLTPAPTAIWKTLLNFQGFEMQKWNIPTDRAWKVDEKIGPFF